MQFSPARIAAALKIQVWTRRYFAQKRLKQMKKQFKNIPPRVYALRLQSRLRGFHARSKQDKELLAKCIKHMSVVAFHAPPRKRAGVLIQSKARSIIVRRKTIRMKKVLLHIVRIVRGFLVRAQQLKTLEVSIYVCVCCTPL
jgi:hypothetical protein